MYTAHNDIDMLLMGGGGGSVGQYHSIGGMPLTVAQKLLRPFPNPKTGELELFNPHALRTYDTLRKEEWIDYDQKVIEISRQRLVAVKTFVAAGLTYPLKNALGHTVIEWEQLGDFDPAEVSMDAVTRAQRDKPDYRMVSMPVPIIHKEFATSIRALAASRNGVRPLDVTSAALAARRVADRIEDVLFNGISIGNIQGGTVYGLLNHPARNTIGFGTNGNWVQVAKTGSDILADVLTLLTIARGDHMYGPYRLFIPANYESKMDDDFKSNSDRTIRERLEAIEAIGTGGITVVDALPSNNVLLVQMTSDVIDIVMGMQPTTVQWETLGGLEQNFKVMAIILPRIKADYNGQCGIVHMS